jgi:hypothetical protein
MRRGTGPSSCGRDVRWGIDGGIGVLVVPSGVFVGVECEGGAKKLRWQGIEPERSFLEALDVGSCLISRTEDGQMPMMAAEYQVFPFGCQRLVDIMSKVEVLACTQLTLEGGWECQGQPSKF